STLHSPGASLFPYTTLFRSKVGIGVWVGRIKSSDAETQPSVPSSIRILIQVPSAFSPSTSTPVPGARAVIALKFVPGPSRTLTVWRDWMTPRMGGTSVGVGVSEGVGGIGVSDGVNVNVGSGVRVATGVAVKRGVRLTIGARVAVGA